MKSTKRTLKIMSFNIRIDVLVDGNHAWQYRKEAIVQYICSQKPDFIGFQEPNPAMVDYLQNQLTQYSHIGLPRDERGESTPLFYLKDQFRLIENHTIWLSKTPAVPSKIPESAFPRIATFGIFESKDQNPFLICNTHLDYISQEVQTLQMEALVQKMDEYSFPKVIMGDFNATSNQSVHRTLHQSEYIHTFSEELLSKASFHGFQGTLDGNPIDYIYISKEWALEKTVIDQNTINPLMLSDHYPIISSIFRIINE